MSKFNKLRNAIKIMAGSAAPDFTITKVSGDQALEFLDFLEALKDSPLKILTESDKLVFTVQTKHRKYFLTCQGEEFELDVIDMDLLRKRLSTVK